MSSEEMFKTPPAKSEFVTRKQIVDRRLRDAGWKIVRFDPLMFGAVIVMNVGSPSSANFSRETA